MLLVQLRPLRRLVSFIGRASSTTCKMAVKREEILLLFDVDGTLTKPRLAIEPSFKEFLYRDVKPRATIGLVGGSDLDKMFEQLNGREILNKFDYVFPENGLVSYVKGEQTDKASLTAYLGEETLQKFINFCLRYLSELKIPVKRGTFIEFRSGMINVSPIGRNCSPEERAAFFEYDKDHKVRQTMINALRKEFSEVDLTYSIGGQISFDVFPNGWDKTYCLRHVTKGTSFREIHFFGDKTDPGGNDHEIFEDARTIGHKVTSPEDTKRQLIQLLNIK
ncbi:phosphomannomutase [Uranotaenia lowii]|uniref:phosphomannomutase n=1 Tax=Uranotaenia lowii TaxID=190385 RepID=UPI0024795AB8|nr:phosphomannomutase [Uranotaenia lowii]XP_055594222.1 phosphomannomutase [Uranotaenia lowii]